MKTQFDNKVRVVSLENLKAMCERVSGVSNGYHIDKITTNRVYVSTNTATAGSVTAIFPCWPSKFAIDGKDNPSVALDILRITGATDDDYDASQEFDLLLDCEPLYRSIADDGAEIWRTEYEILSAKYGFSVESRWFQDCLQFWRVMQYDDILYMPKFFPGDPEPMANTDQAPGEYRDYRDAQAAVVAYCKRLGASNG
jgi:hypothetical protein